MYWEISLVVHWLRLCTLNAGGPGQGTRSPMLQLRARLLQLRARLLQRRSRTRQRRSCMPQLGPGAAK